ncbi:MAG: hypothetical protein UY49_C0012G0001, partial [Microgenomates group bacterium GW2011_GWC1_49_7]
MHTNPDPQSLFVVQVSSQPLTCWEGVGVAVGVGVDVGVLVGVGVAVGVDVGVG